MGWIFCMSSEGPSDATSLDFDLWLVIIYSNLDIADLDIVHFAISVKEVKLSQVSFNRTMFLDNWSCLLLAFLEEKYCASKKTFVLWQSNRSYATWQLNLSVPRSRKYNKSKGPIDEPCHLARSHVPFFDFYLIFGGVHISRKFIHRLDLPPLNYM